MRRICALFVLCALLMSAPAAQARTEDILQDGVIPFAAAGELVVLVQTRLRELGYFHFKPTGRFQGMTRDSVIAFQTYQEDDSGAAFIADGRIGAQSISALFSARAARAPIPQELHIPKGRDADGSQAELGAATPWADVKEMLQAGNTYTLMDFNTGVVMQVVYTGGAEHAEVECATTEDTEIFKQAFGGEYSWFKRPMLLLLDGARIACSLQGQPHGESTVNGNDMPGHACLYFSESKSHVGGLQDVEHRDNVYTAAGNVR